MSLTGPEEDEFVLALSCASGVWVLVFPYWSELQHLYYTDEMAPARRRRLMRFFRACVKRQLYLNGADKIHLSKNPTFSGKIESLIETFPDARFVVCMRSPYETIPSLLKLMTRNWKAGRCPPARIEESRRLLTDQSFHTYTYPFEALAKHPETRWIAVDYRDLVDRPKRSVEEIYDALGLEMTPGYGFFKARGKPKAAKVSNSRLEEWWISRFHTGTLQIRMRSAIHSTSVFPPRVEVIKSISKSGWEAKH